MSLVPLRYGVTWIPFNTTVLVSIYTGDGTVAIVHGGVEIGQGINTKVSQNNRNFKNNHFLCLRFVLYVIPIPFILIIV